MYLYVHITPSNKMYIGITQNIVNRWRVDGSGYKTSVFWRAIQKYGWNNIKHIILLEGLTKEVACECEKYLIAKYQTNNPKYGYNVADGGEFNSGFTFHHTEEAKKKIGDASRGHIISEKQKLQISMAHKGVPISDETKAKLSKTISDMMDDEYRYKISESVKRRWKEGAYVNRKKSSKPVWNKGLTKDTDVRIANSCRKVGEFHHTEEAKRKMSESHKGKPAHNRKKILCVETGIIYSSVAEAGKLTGISNISLAARQEYRTAGKLHWRYIDD